MKSFLFLLPLALLSVKCSSQLKSDVELKQSAFDAAKKFGDAILEHDYEKIYVYGKIKDMSLDEFVKASKEFEQDQAESGIKFNEIKVNPPLAVVHCKKQIQVLMHRTILATISGKSSQFEARIVALSEDGENWVFDVLSKDQSKESAQKMYPYFCKEIYENW